MPSPLTPLTIALSTGSTYTALLHLQALNSLTPIHLPSSYSALTVAKAAQTTALRDVHCAILPTVRLPTAVHALAPQLHILLAQYVADLRARLQHPALLSPVSSVNLPFHALDDASVALAQAVSADVADLSEIWNSAVPSALSSSPDDLPRLFTRATALTDQRRYEAICLEARIVETRRVAVALLHRATRAAVDAVDEDCRERGDNSADEIRVEALAARSLAITAKLRLLGAEIASLLYSPDSVRALHIIAKEVTDRTSQITRRLEVVKGRLHMYRALGYEFEHLVVEYGAAEKVYEQKLWSKAELAS